MSRRTDRLASLIRRTLGQLLLSKISDPRVDPVKTTITSVEVADDMMSARVLVSVADTEARQRNTLRALRHASGHIQELMMDGIRLRHTPILTFVLDTQYKKTMETLRIIDQAMDEIRSKDDADETEDADQLSDSPDAGLEEGNPQTGSNQTDRQAELP